MFRPAIRMATSAGVLAACMAFGGVAFAQSGGAMPSARDGQSLSTQTPATQAMFIGTWGSQAGQEWVTEHNAQIPAVQAAAPPPAPAPAPPPPVSIPVTPPAPGQPAGTPSTVVSTGTVNIIVVAPLPNLIQDIHSTFTLTGFAYSPAGAISHVELYLDTTPTSASPIDLGAAQLGNSGGLQPPSGYPSGSGFSTSVNPQAYPPYQHPTNGQVYTSTAWPAGGHVINVVAYGPSGAMGTVALPIVTQ